MKLHYTILLSLVTSLSADPLITSWFTENSGSYATIYTVASPTTPVSTWSRGDGVQALPTYAGIHELSYTDNWLYLRTTNLASYTMGPWYQDKYSSSTAEFPNYPANTATAYRFPRTPDVSSSTTIDTHTYSDKTLTRGGIIGFMVNGVSIYDSRDAFSYNGTTNINGGFGAWNRDAYLSESGTFDPANAHQASITHHYHANPPGLRHQLGDSVDFDSINNEYTENFNGNHSPIIGWMRDGLPVYGPYGYSDPLDISSGVRRMISGFQLRNITVRTAWPAWATRIYGGTGQSFSTGPAVSTTFPLGQYLEDYEYKGDTTSLTLGNGFDLNEFNTRYCKTPEFPDGTWAYFTCIESDGTPVFPYNTTRAYLGEPTGGASDIPDAADTDPHTIYFEGGPELTESLDSIEINAPSNGEVTITWDAVEGGVYEVSQSTDLGDTDSWETIASNLSAASNKPSVVETYGAGAVPDKNFYQLTRTDLAAFDDTGFEYSTSTAQSIVISTFTTTTGTLPPNLSNTPTSVTFNGVDITAYISNVIRPTQNSITFDYITSNIAPGSYEFVFTFTNANNGNISTATYTYTVSNILFIIVDDWGIDRSPIDDTALSIAATATEASGFALPYMPTLQTLADAGLNFSNAYAQAQCSPTRATIMTGRQPSQHGIGIPSGSALLSEDGEYTIPEIMTLMGAPHETLNVGKWHLGGDDDAYATAGGWQQFYGIQSAGVTDYYDWSKNSNGTITTSTTYTTTDQVNEAVAFIEASDAADKPWFTWVAFNAPHAPFHDPPTGLGPYTGLYSTQKSGETNVAYRYRKMLEAMDTEMARLLTSVDQSVTEIIIIGDNGTPNRVIQLPFSDGHSKGTIYQGGIRVPLVITGPSTTATPDTSDELVHCVDIFSTILEMANIDTADVAELTVQDIRSTSIVPILQNTDTLERAVIVEMKHSAATNGIWSRAIILDSYPDYKLVVTIDPSVSATDETYVFYNITDDPDEQAALDTSTLTGTDADAYSACLLKDDSLGSVYNSSL